VSYDGGCGVPGDVRRVFGVGGAAVLFGGAAAFGGAGFGVAAAFALRAVPPGFGFGVAAFAVRAVAPGCDFRDETSGAEGWVGLRLEAGRAVAGSAEPRAAVGGESGRAFAHAGTTSVASCSTWR
jgi:hypothetical protein